MYPSSREQPQPIMPLLASYTDSVCIVCTSTYIRTPKAETSPAKCPPRQVGMYLAIQSASCWHTYELAGTGPCRTTRNGFQHCPHDVLSQKLQKEAGQRLINTYFRCREPVSHPAGTAAQSGERYRCEVQKRPAFPIEDDEETSPVTALRGSLDTAGKCGL